MAVLKFLKKLKEANLLLVQRRQSNFCELFETFQNHNKQLLFSFEC